MDIRYLFPQQSSYLQQLASGKPGGSGFKPQVESIISHPGVSGVRLRTPGETGMCLGD